MDSHILFLGFSNHVSDGPIHDIFAFKDLC